jgi:hypothetical protein
VKRQQNTSGIVGIRRAICSPGGVRLLSCSPVLAVLLLLSVLPGCAENVYQSAMPPFVVHYPASWQTAPGVGEVGAMTIFSPDKKIGPDSPRVTLQVTSTGDQPAVPAKDDPRTLNLSVQKDLGRLGNGQRGRRYVVTKFPTVWVVEAYASSKEFVTIRAVAERMVKELNPTLPAPVKP